MLGPDVMSRRLPSGLMGVDVGVCLLMQQWTKRDCPEALSDYHVDGRWWKSRRREPEVQIHQRSGASRVLKSDYDATNAALAPLSLPCTPGNL